MGELDLRDELDAWDALSDEALAEFEKLIDECEPPGNEFPKTIDGWLDWLMGR